MHFSVEKEIFFNALSSLQSVVEKKNTIQILGNILFVAEDSTLSLFATDLEVGMKISIPVQVLQAGKLTLGAKQLADIVKELPNRGIEIKKKQNDWVELTCGKYRVNLAGLAADQYPSLPLFENRNYVEARSDVLSTMIERTEFAVSTDATRYHLNGVYLEQVETGVFRMTATDGHRLAFMDQEVFKSAIELKKGIIIPKKGLSEIQRLIGKKAETLSFAFDKGYLFSKSGDTFLFVRLIDGEYPDYRQVIPKQADQTAKIGREEFAGALKRVSLLAHEKSRGVKLIFKDQMLTIISSNPDLGDAVEEIDVHYSGQPVEIGFNARYLLDCLPVIDSTEIDFRFKDKSSPGLIQSTSSKNYTYIVMPMRV